MQRIITVILVIQGLLLPLTAQTQDRPLPLKGFVVDERDSTAIPNVHIINLNRVKGTTSGNDGSFGILVNPGDSILFQAVGFVSDTLKITTEMLVGKERVIVPLIDKTYQLPTVDVYPWATFTDFKYAFLNFEDPESPINLNLPPVEFQPEPGEGVGIVIPGPITALYDHFSRRGRELAKYREVSEETVLARRASRVVNPEIVKRLTGIESEQEYYIFLDFCNISDEYIVSTQEYQVYQRILQCYKQYAELK
ncbi:MAG: carboxypeptidase-like regulatory domain-containing protein [Bacteroidales bacterium]|nr:carboxypeptidase-like regulatory domain-containing protein [Bacteroidales bacterium]